MINNLNIMLPEIFLSLSIFFILLLGVFIKKSFNLIFNLTSVIIIITIDHDISFVFMFCGGDGGGSDCGGGVVVE